MLTIIGLSLFELLFEARARYLYIYAPFYILLAVYGVREIRSGVLRLLKKCGSPEKQPMADHPEQLSGHAPQ